MRELLALGIIAWAQIPSSASAFVGTPVGGHPGELDLNAVVTAACPSAWNPRIDYVAGGFNVGVELQTWLGIETTFYLGSGTGPPARSRTAPPRSRACSTSRPDAGHCRGSLVSARRWG